LQTVTGIITPHRGRGTRLGVPTINLPAPADIPDGVYAGYVQHQSNRYPAAVFVGAAITFGEQDRQIEAHIIDQTITLTGAVTIDLIKCIRPNQRFPNSEQLQQQMQSDIRVIKQCLQELSQNN